METLRTTLPRLPHRAATTMLLTIALWTAGQILAVSPAVAAGHDDARCDRCHGAAAAAVGTVSVERDACTRCHVKAARAAGQPDALFHADPSQSCVRCHRYHDPQTVVTARGNLDLAALAGVNPEHCRTCHQPRARRDRLSPGHEAAATLYHERAGDLVGLSPSAACRACHGRNATLVAWRGASDSQPISFADHTSHPCDVPVRPGQATIGSRIRPDIDPRLAMPGGRLECVTCHDLTAETTSSLVAFADPRDLCLGCHQLKEPEPTTIAAIDLISPKIPN